MSKETLETLFEKYTIVHTQPVAWGEMDAFKHVNNVVYYRYIENARIVYLNQLNIMTHDDIHVVIHSNNCKYIRPVTYPDTLYIGVNITEVRNSSFTMTYDIYSESQNTLVAQAQAVIVTVDSQTNMKCAMPDDLRSQITVKNA